MSDRIRCINPRCRRTAPRDKHPNAEWVICGKCWKVTPARIRARHKQLRRLQRRLLRALDRGRYKYRASLWIKMEEHLWNAWERWDAEVRHYFREPDAPVGLEAFLEETGL